MRAIHLNVSLMAHHPHGSKEHMETAVISQRSDYYDRMKFGSNPFSPYKQRLRPADAYDMQGWSELWLYHMH